MGEVGKGVMEGEDAGKVGGIGQEGGPDCESD